MCGCLLCAPTGDLACNPGTCPDWESNQWPFGSQAGTQSTEPHQPGPKVIVLMNLNFCVIFNNAFLDWHHKDNAFSYDDKCFQVLSSHSQVSAHLERTRKSNVTEGSYRILLTYRELLSNRSVFPFVQRGSHTFLWWEQKSSQYTFPHAHWLLTVWS